MYIYGKNVVIESILNGDKIKEIYLYENFSDVGAVEILEKSKIKVKYMKKDELNKMTKGNHQGIIAKVPDYEYSDLSSFTKDENSLVVILDHLEDPHNFGAIIRTCEAAGVNGIIIPKDRSVSVNPTVIKVSAGTADSVPITMVTNLNNTIKDLKKEGFWIVGTDMNGTDYSTINYEGKIAIVIGNEGNGMSRMVKESCDFIASINMRGKTNSLNASVAAGIVIFEAVKCRV